MRLVPVESIKRGSLLGRNIYDYDRGDLLRAGTILTEPLIKRIKKLNFFSLYIIDEYSSAEIEDIIKPELRQKCISSIRKAFCDIGKIKLVHNFKKSSFNKYSKKEQDYFNSINDITEELLENVLSNKSVLLSLVDIKNMDSYTYSHCVNVGIISVILGISLNLPQRNLIDLCIGGFLHDIGKAFIPRDILQKKNKLTLEEFEVIKEHSRYGYEFISNWSNLSTYSKLIILQHHERFDGLGYPNKLSDNQITYLARIVSIADVYDALTSNRPYKKAICPSKAFQYIMSNAGTMFDCDIICQLSDAIVL